MEDTETKNAIGKTLYNERHKRNLTKKQMANMLHITVTTYARWENCKTLPRGKNVNAIAKTLNIKMNTLLGLNRQP